jgi:uncharacterized protein DUF6130
MKQPDDRSRGCFLKASSMSGLAVELSPATIGEAFADSKSKTTQKENTMTQPGATQRNRKLADESSMPNTRKSESVTGRAGRSGAASKTARERAAKQHLTGYGHEHATPHVPSGIVMRAAVIGIMAALYALSAVAQTAKEVKGATPLVAIPNEPPPQLIVDPPIPEQLAQGRVFIQYRAENLRILPVFGNAALAVSPRIGHLHYYVDGQSWPIVDTSGETVVLVGLPSGPHQVKLELADATHKPIPGCSKVVEFTIPPRK